MKFSNGWLQKFKQRCTLNSFKLNGDPHALIECPQPVATMVANGTSNAIGVNAAGIGSNLSARSPQNDISMTMVVANATMASIEKAIYNMPEKGHMVCQ